MLFLLNVIYATALYIFGSTSILTSLWVLFIKSNFLNVLVKPAKTDQVKPTEIIKKLSYSVLLSWISWGTLMLLVYLNFYNGSEFSLWWNQLNATNISYNLISLIVLILLILFKLFHTLTSNNTNYNADFFFSLANIICFVIFLYMVSTMYGLVFVLEMNAIIVFYKFTTSRYWYKAKTLIKKNVSDLYNRILPKQYLNMLFFQYWSTFFSSILLFYSVVLIVSFYSTTDFILVDVLNLMNYNVQYLTNTNFIAFLWIPFIFGFLIKIGLTPFHLFKIEVYKGLPLITILFYTTFYFFSYFLYLVILLCINVISVKFLLNSILYTLVTLGALYMSSLIFDITSLKAFFAYSTIINSILIFVSTTII